MAIETLMHNTEPLGALLGDASDIIFDNGGTSFTGDNVQDALEEVDSRIDDVNDKTADDIEYSAGVSVKDKIDEVNLTDGGAIDGSLVVGKSTSANTYLAVGSPTSKGILNLTNNDKVVGIEADTLTANRVIKVPNNSGTIALTSDLEWKMAGSRTIDGVTGDWNLSADISNAKEVLLLLSAGATVRTSVLIPMARIKDSTCGADYVFAGNRNYLFFEYRTGTKLYVVMSSQGGATQISVGLYYR